MRVANLSREVATVAWLVNKLPARYQRDLPGLVATIFVKGTFQLSPSAPAIPWPGTPLPPNGDIPMEQGGLRYAADYVPYKEHGEWSLVGHAHGPSNTSAITRYPCGVEIGSARKELVIHGERRWQPSLVGDLPGPAGPVAPLDLSYRYAMGGANIALNPIGCGVESEEMPRIEGEGMPVLNRIGAMPAGFAPIPATWPQRASRLGNYHAPWAEECWPWFPEDFDVHYFQSAPASQWIEGYWRGDETICLKNLIEGQPQFQTQLPGVRAHCYVERQQSSRTRLLERVSLMLDTIWIDIDQKQLVCVWRGRCPTLTVKMKDISSILVFTEPLQAGEPDLEEVCQRMEDAIRPKAPPPKVLAPEADPRDLADLEMFKTEKRLHEIRLEAYQAIATQHAHHQPVEARMREVTQDALNQAVSRGNVDTLDGSKRLTDVDAPLEQFFAKQGMQGFKASEVFAHSPEPEAIKSLAKQAADAGQTITVAEVRYTRQDFLLADGTLDLVKMRRLGCEAIDFSGVDFSGLNIGKIRFNGARMAGARLRGAVLTGSDFSGADMTGADLSGAILGAALLLDADLSKCRVEKTDWRKAILFGAILAGLDLSEADFTGAQASMADFTKCRLKRVCFEEAMLMSASFACAELDAAQFIRANLSFADFRGAKARASNFMEAEMQNFRGDGGADFADAYFDRIQAKQSIWEKSTVSGASFEEAELEGARFVGATAVNGNFFKAHMTCAVLEDGVFTRASFKGANLLRASMERADLTGADFDYSNLYQVGLWDATLLHSTWHHAYVKGTKLDF